MHQNGIEAPLSAMKPDFFANDDLSMWESLTLGVHSRMFDVITTLNVYQNYTGICCHHAAKL